MTAKRHWSNIFKMLRVNNCQLEFCSNFLENTPRLETFSNKQELRKFTPKISRGYCNIYICFGKKENISRQAVKRNGDKCMSKSKH